MFKNICIIFFLIVWTFTSVAQNSVNEVEKLLKSSQETFKKYESFKFDLTYRLFSHVDNPVSISKYRGVFIKNKANSYLKIKDTEFFYVNNLIIKINHSQKAIEINQVEDSVNTFDPVAIEQQLKNFSTTKTYVLENGDTKCVLTAPKYTQLPYGRIDVVIDTKTNLFKKQRLYLLNSSNIKDENNKISNENKYLDITLENISLNSNGIITVEDYFIDYNKGNIKLKEIAQDYKVIDRR